MRKSKCPLCGSRRHNQRIYYKHAFRMLDAYGIARPQNAKQRLYGVVVITRRDLQTYVIKGMEGLGAAGMVAADGFRELTDALHRFVKETVAREVEVMKLRHE